MPTGWSPGMVPIRDALLTGIANAFSFIFSLLAYVRLANLIMTATDGFLDLISQDFFGDELPRFANQTDASFLARIQANMLSEKVTRQAMIDTLTKLTGTAPVIVEPRQPGDCGAYGAPNCGYNVAGAYGSLLLPYQAFVTAFRPPETGIPIVAGYNTPFGGYGAGSIEYVASASVTNAASDADIYAAITAVRPAATVIWARITSGSLVPEPGGGGGSGGSGGGGGPPGPALTSESGSALTTETGNTITT